MFCDVDYAGCCSIMWHHCHVVWASNSAEGKFARYKGSRRSRPIRLDSRRLGNGWPDEATNRKQFPYMEVLDSNRAEQDY